MYTILYTILYTIYALFIAYQNTQNYTNAKKLSLLHVVPFCSLFTAVSRIFSFGFHYHISCLVWIVLRIAFNISSLEKWRTHAHMHTHTHTHAKELSFWFKISDQNMYVMSVVYLTFIYTHTHSMFHYLIFNQGETDPGETTGML